MKQYFVAWIKINRVFFFFFWKKSGNLSARDFIFESNMTSLWSFREERGRRREKRKNDVMRDENSIDFKPEEKKNPREKIILFLWVISRNYHQ